MKEYNLQNFPAITRPRNTNSTDQTQSAVCLPQLRPPRNYVLVLFQILGGPILVLVLVVRHPRLGPRVLASLRPVVVARVLLVLVAIRDGTQAHVHVQGRRETNIVDGHGPLGSSQLPAIRQSRLLLLHSWRVNCRSARSAAKDCKLVLVTELGERKIRAQQVMR